jgi:hypothetical protein
MGSVFLGEHCNIYEVFEGRKYTKAGRQAIEITLEINDSGRYYAVFGVCQGFELMVAVVGKNIGLVEICEKCTDYCAVLNFTEMAKEHSKLFSAFSEYQ